MLIDAANLSLIMRDARKAKAADRPRRLIRDQSLSKKRASRARVSRRQEKTGSSDQHSAPIERHRFHFRGDSAI
jgi:hypothetical protein